jgi:hypothetical protein
VRAGVGRRRFPFGVIELFAPAWSAARRPPAAMHISHARAHFSWAVSPAADFQAKPKCPTVFRGEFAVKEKSV